MNMAEAGGQSKGCRMRPVARRGRQWAIWSVRPTRRDQTVMSSNRPRWSVPAPWAWSLGLAEEDWPSEAGDTDMPAPFGCVGRVGGTPMPGGPIGAENADRELIAIMNLMMNHIPEELVNGTFPATYLRW